MKKKLSLLFAIILVASSFFCFEFSAQATSKITTPETSLIFAKGCSNTLVMYLDGKRAGGGSLSFSSSNKSVASVDSNGKITAKKKGKANIIVKSKKNKKVTKTVNITVLDGKSFSITPSSAPLNGDFLNFSTYNSKTKNYYAIRSYLEYFEKHSGCTLSLKKGTYNVTNVLYIPSDSTVKLLDGVVINKTSSTGTSKLKASATLFALCAPSKANKKDAYKAYSGVHDVKILGYKTATVNMKNTLKDKISVSVVLCHNKNVTISGINFTNLKYGHFIEMDASKNVLIQNCKFSNQVHSLETSPSECINIDTPDSATNGFHQTWAKNDCYPDEDVKIINCSFNNVQRGLGTHQYSENKYHKNITIKDCSFKKCVYGGIYAMNWKNTFIENNTFNGIGKDTNGKSILSQSITSKSRVLFFAGCSNGLKVTGNSFSNCYQVGAVSSHTANGFKTIYNSISDNEFEEMVKNNHIDKNVTYPYVKAYVNWDGNNSKWAEYYIEG